MNADEALRGLWLFSAWLNNTDTRRANTMDVFVPSETEPQLGSVVHYLLDFGDSLGAAGTQPKFPGQGYESRLDWALIGRELFSFGLAYRYWLPVQRSPFRSVGLYEAQVFRPERWRPNLPNPAFDDADALDTYWAGSIIARFQPEHLLAVVDAADYVEPGAREWILRVLLARQYKVLDLAFRRVLPLDQLKIDRWTVSMTDLAVQANLLLRPDEVRYRWSSEDSEGRELDGGTTTAPTANLRRTVETLTRQGGLSDRPFFTINWWRLTTDRQSPRLQIHMRVVEGGQLLPVALERSVGPAR